MLFFVFICLLHKYDFSFAIRYLTKSKSKNNYKNAYEKMKNVQLKPDKKFITHFPFCSKLKNNIKKQFFVTDLYK